MLAVGVLTFASSRTSVSLLLVGALVACGDDPSGDGAGSGGGDAGGGGAGVVTSTVAGPVAVSSSATTAATTGGGSPTSSSTGSGGDGGAGGGPPLECTDEPLPGAGGCTADDPRAATPDDCSTPENEGCTARALCGAGAPPFPVPAGPAVAFAERDGAVGTVDGELVYTELLAEGSILGTSTDGRAVIREGSIASDVVSILHADGSLGASWLAIGLERAAVTSNGRIVLATSYAGQAYVDGLDLEGEGQLAVATLTAGGGVAWGRRLGHSEHPEGTIDIRGFAALGDDLVIVGQYERVFDLGGVELPEVIPWGDLGYVARIDGASGDVLWAQPIGHPDGGTANALAITADGDILVGGAVSPGADAAGTVATLVRLSPDGDRVWESQTGGSALGGRQAIDDLAVTPSGTIVGVGFFSGVLRAGGIQVVNGPFARDAMILSFDDADGSITSVRTWGGHPIDEPLGGARAGAWAVSSFCDHVVVAGNIDALSQAFIAGYAVENPGDGSASVVLELPAEGTWPAEGGVGGDVCEDAQAYCAARVDRSLGCDIADDEFSCQEEEPCLTPMLREDVACDLRTCETSAPCDVDCAEVGLDSVLTEVGATFEAACEAAIGGGCGEYLPVGTCERMAHRQSDTYLEALMPCVTPARSCVSTWMCLRAVEDEWEHNAAGCGPEPGIDPAICADEAVLCDAIAGRSVSCDGSLPFSHASDTAEECLARRAGFDATYRDEVECLLESCFAGAACHVDCRDRVVLAPPSALGEALIEGCLLVGSCADLFTGECAMIAHSWPDERIEVVLPCFDGTLSCDEAADCLGDVGPNTWYP